MSEPKSIRVREKTKTERQYLTEFTSAFESDSRLFLADIEVNLAYSEALFHAGVLNRLEAERIKNGLQAIRKRAEHDQNYFAEHHWENVHSFVIGRLVQLIGETGRKLRIGRRENEQLLTVLRIVLRLEIEKISSLAKEFQIALVENAERRKKALLPVITNLQKGQSILWAHWCLAYFEMFARDRDRLDETWRRVNISPFGAETSFEIDREEIAAALGFEGISANGFDSESDRDFLIEFIHSGALLMTHLSHFARDLMIYGSEKFNFVQLDENDKEALERICQKASRIFGHQTAFLSTANFPVSNLREETEAIFDTSKIIESCLLAANWILENLTVNEEITRKAAAEGYSNALELTDYLLKKDVPFNDARETTHKIAALAAAKSREIGNLSLDEMQNFSAKIESDVYQAISLDQALAGKNQIGGTSPERVFEAIEAARLWLERENG